MVEDEGFGPYPYPPSGSSGVHQRMFWTSPNTWGRDGAEDYSPLQQCAL